MEFEPAGAVIAAAIALAVAFVAHSVILVGAFRAKDPPVRPWPTLAIAWLTIQFSAMGWGGMAFTAFSFAFTIVLYRQRLARRIAAMDPDWYR